MEPTAYSVTIPGVRVEKVVRQTYKQYLRGVGETAEFAEIFLGWFILLEGSHEALYLGKEQPPFVDGDRVDITISKVHNALPVKTPVQ